MDPKQFGELVEVVKKQVDESVAIAVPKHVNGHIKDLTQKVDGYIKEDIQWKQEDKKWKDSAQPSVNLGTKVINFTDVLKWILVTGASIAGFILAIKTINGLFK